MARPRSIPLLSRHCSGNAVARIDGRDHYLGRYGTSKAETDYESLIARWLADGRRLEIDGSPERTVNEIALAFLNFAAGQNRLSSRGTNSDLDCFKSATKVLRTLYGGALTPDFGPKALKSVRAAMVAKAGPEALQTIRSSSRVDHAGA